MSDTEDQRRTRRAIGVRGLALVTAVLLASSQAPAAAQGTLSLDPVEPVPARVSVSAPLGGSGCTAVASGGQLCVVV